MHLARSLAASAFALCAAACQTDDVATKNKLDKLHEQAERLDSRLNEIAKKGGFSGGPGPVAAGPGQQQPPGPPPTRPPPPDNTTVYSLPVDGNPAWGPRTAKVTLVDVFDFA